MVSAKLKIRLLLVEEEENGLFFSMGPGGLGGPPGPRGGPGPGPGWAPLPPGPPVPGLWPWPGGPVWGCDICGLFSSCLYILCCCCLLQDCCGSLFAPPRPGPPGPLFLEFRVILHDGGTETYLNMDSTRSYLCYFCREFVLPQAKCYIVLKPK